jgi:23S rRNA pseudouridine1911/1915/1917 synthase
VIVVDKPAGLVVHPGAGNPTGTLVNGVLAFDPAIAGVGDPMRPGIVHRLDRDTSGLLVVARSARAYDSLVAQLGARTVERAYVALAWGHFESTRGVIDAPIGRSEARRTRMAVRDEGRPARTRYEVREVFESPRCTRLECSLETGRTHQIRVHLAAINHPIVGDATYGGGRQPLMVSRPFLHAAALAFVHPATGDMMRFTSALPAELQRTLDDLARDPAT